MFDFDDSSRCPVTTGLTEGRRKFKFVAVLISDATADTKSRHVGVKFHPIPMPHGKLFLGIAPIGFSR
jgi:hypothetical protein